jgi:UDP-GlcNAc:undecaprenyl-phosphate GlcNAc-1-phosphate transferase
LTLIIRHFGVVTNLPFIFEDYRGIFNIAVTMLWLTGVCSAMNAIDHMDGLAGGIAGIAALSYLAISVQTGQWRWGTISISLFGALLGFLVFNWHPAKIFMGDSGSFFLGFSLGSIGIMGGWSEEPLESVIIPFSILSIPVVDLIYVLVIRRITGVTKTLRESIVYCGKDHIGHRFCQLGFSQVNSVRIICLLSMTISISALLIKYTENLQSILLLFQILLVYIVVFILMKHPDGHKEGI